jgi:glycosyltransferase involved in cell wall biosynthesis
VIAGQGTPPRRLIRLIAQAGGAELLGPVADPEEVYRTSRIFVDPSRGGAGGRVKVLNAMARGLPVVATPDAAEGLQAVDGEHLLVADAPSAMAEAIRDLLSDDQRWLSLSRAGRDLVRRHHVPDRAFVALDEVLTSAAGGAGTE